MSAGGCKISVKYIWFTIMPAMGYKQRCLNYIELIFNDNIVDLLKDRQ